MNGMVLYKRGKFKVLLHYYINRNTPVGEPPNFYEPKPYGVKRLIDEKEIFGFIKGDIFSIYSCTMTDVRMQLINKFVKNNSLKISNELFHNGYVYTTYQDPLKRLKL